MANAIEIIGSWPSGETEYVIGAENPSRLPPVSDADNGDVLTVVNGSWQDAAPTGGGGGLPSVTSEDNGDFLGVNNGAWSKVGGYSVTEELETIISEQTVTTQPASGMNMAAVSGSIASLEEGSTCYVTYNGTKYTAPVITVSMGGGTPVPAIGETAGASFDFTHFPFFFMEGGGTCRLLTATATTATVKIEKVSKTVTVSDDFKAAVLKVLEESNA